MRSSFRLGAAALALSAGLMSAHFAEQAMGQSTDQSTTQGNAYFAGAPELAVESTEPLATANIVAPTIYAPSTPGSSTPGDGTPAPSTPNSEAGVEGHSFYVFGIGKITEVQLDSGKVTTHSIPFDRDSHGIYDAGANAAWLGPDRKIYFAMFGKPARIGRFDPATERMELLGALEGHSKLRHLWGPDGKCYVITYPATLGVVDAATGAVRSLGRLTPDSLYVHGKMEIATDGYLYASPGQRPKRHVRVNLTTGEIEPLDVMPEYEPVDAALANLPELDERYDVKVEAEAGEATVTFSRKGDEASQRTVSFACSTVPRSIMVIHHGPDGLIHGGGSYEQFTFDPATGAMSFPAYRLSIYDYLTVGDDIYFGGYPNARVGRLDTTRPLELHGKTPLWELNDDTHNPREVTNIHNMSYDGEDAFNGRISMKRSWGLALGADGKVYIANSGSRQIWGGALAAYDPTTGETTYIREPFRYLALHDIAEINGGEQLALVSIVASDPLFPGQEPDEASLFVYDVARGEIVQQASPIPGCKVLVSVVQAPGTSLLVGVGIPDVQPLPQHDNNHPGRAELFIYDMQTQQTVKRIAFDFESNRNFARTITPAPDGSLWMGAGDGIVRIDPANLTAEPIARVDDTGQIVFIGNTIYMAGGPTLRHADVSHLLRTDSR